MAEDALGDPDCSSIFGLSPNSMDPKLLLANLINGLSDHGYPNSGPGYINTTTGLGDATAALTGEVGQIFFANNTYSDQNVNGDRVVSDIVAITINSNAWNVHTAAYNAAVLIHELGHVFNELKGAGGSLFAQDTNPVTGATDFGAEAYNATLEKRCIH
jgi:hypothetical protein